MAMSAGKREMDNLQRLLAKRTCTPLYVLQGGKVVNINPVRCKRANGRNHGKSG